MAVSGDTTASSTKMDGLIKKPVYNYCKILFLQPALHDLQVLLSVLTSVRPH